MSASFEGTLSDQGDSPQEKSTVTANTEPENGTAQYKKDDEVAIQVKEDGLKMKKEMFVENVRPVAKANLTVAQTFEYQLKTSKESKDLHEKGKWFKETELEEP